MSAYTYLSICAFNRYLPICIGSGVLEESEVRALLIKMSLPHNDTAVKKTRVELDQLVLENIPRAASVNAAFGDVLSAGRLKLRMDKLVKGRQQNREGRADAVVWGATKEQFNCWYRDRVKGVCTSSIDVLFGTTSPHAWWYFVWPQVRKMRSWPRSWANFSL